MLAGAGVKNETYLEFIKKKMMLSRHRKYEPYFSVTSQVRHFKKRKRKKTIEEVCARKWLRKAAQFLYGMRNVAKPPCLHVGDQR